MLSFIDCMLLVILAGLFAASFFYPVIQLGHVILFAAIVTIFMLLRITWHVKKIMVRVYQMPMESVAQLIKNLIGK
jgi:hypothetical protein